MLHTTSIDASVYVYIYICIYTLIRIIYIYIQIQHTCYIATLEVHRSTILVLCMKIRRVIHQP